MHFSDDLPLTFSENQGPYSLKTILITLCSIESTPLHTCMALSPPAQLAFYIPVCLVLPPKFWLVSGTWALCGCVITGCKQSNYTHIYTKPFCLLGLEKGGLFFLSSLIVSLDNVGAVVCFKGSDAFPHVTSREDPTVNIWKKGEIWILGVFFLINLLPAHPVFR